MTRIHIIRSNDLETLICHTGLSSLGVLGVPWHPQILADQLTLSQPGGADFAHHITTDIPGFSDFPTSTESVVEFPGQGSTF